MGKIYDLTGQTFSFLTVIDRAENGKDNLARWNCVCICGNKSIKYGKYLKNGETKSCGCLKKQFEDLTGQKFSRLLVVERVESTDGRISRYNCLCDCGNYRIVQSSSLKNNHTTSCGCWHIEQAQKTNRTHGKHKSSEYVTWYSMKTRCYSETKAAKNYRDRGIKICDRWLESFENFYEDMGDKPSPKHSIDRIDNNGDYCPENCRWATREEQNSNRRNTITLTLNGETKTAKEWSSCLNKNYNTIISRKKAGWTDFKVLTEP